MKKYIILLFVIAFMASSCSRSTLKRPTDVKNNTGVVVKEVQGKTSDSCAYLVKFPSNRKGGYTYEWFHLYCGQIKVGDETALYSNE
jgi:hypothetical protein